MPNIDFDLIFSDFATSNGDSSAIRDIYDIIPTLEMEQIKVLTCLIYYIEKYDLSELRLFVREYAAQMAKNKTLNFTSSLNVKSLLRAYTQEELIKGIRVSSLANKDGGGL